MSIIIMILLLSILILVHEAGHFFAARYFNIKVDKFGFGLPIGPVLYETKWGDTKILIHALLLGGYVSFPDDEKDCELDANSPERFANKPIYQRAIVISAGVMANVICAFVLVFLTAALWGHIPSGKYNIYINEIVAPKSESIWQSGLQKKDEIYKINGTKIDTTFALLNFIQMSKSYDGKIDESLALDNFIKLKKLNPAFADNEIIPKDVAVKLPEITMEAPIQIDSKVLKGMKKHKDSQIKLSASQKKLRDEIKIQNKYVSDEKYNLKDISYAISDNSRPIHMEVIRNGRIVDLNTIYANEKGLIGIKLEAKEILIPTKNPVQIIKTGTKFLYDNTYMMIYGLYQIFTGQISLKDLHGIVVITKIGGDIIQNNGIFSGLLLTAIISMNLAIVNFLPIPALDGGHIIFLTIEKLLGRPLDEKIIEKVGNACFLFLIGFMLLLIVNDIWSLITKKF